MQGEVEIPFSSLGFAQIKFQFLRLFSWASSQIYFL